nr:chymotrypsin inhibitor-like [Nomia melanderi]
MFRLFVTLLFCSALVVFCTADNGCPPNEIRWCSTLCEPSCAIPEPRKVGCISELVCRPEGIQNGPCRCADGYVRDNEGSCIDLGECPDSFNL